MAQQLGILMLEESSFSSAEWLRQRHAARVRQLGPTLRLKDCGQAASVWDGCRCAEVHGLPVPGDAQPCHNSLRTSCHAECQSTLEP